MFYRIAWIILIYSFLGWVGETVFTGIRQKRFVNRGVLNSPLCLVYGISAVIMTYMLRDLQNDLPFLFLFCSVYATVIEWIAGHLLERTRHGRWWDYSSLPWNLDGYVCLPFSALWGVLGVIVVKWINPLLLNFYNHVPASVVRISTWVALAILLVDAVGSFYILTRKQGLLPQVAAANHRLLTVTNRFGNWIVKRVGRRIQKAHPQVQTGRMQKQTEVFAQGCGFDKLMLLFVIGCLLGDLTETIFCRLTAGVWMSRSSLVWGPFSVVWGLALALGTLMLYKHKDRSDMFLFLFGTFLGGAYEYFCSVFTEICYGTVFWDYSHIPFNLGGRINLLYCFFWGFAAVIWLKYLYPLLSKQIEKLPMRFGKILVWVLTVFMVVNMAVSAAALARCNQRSEGVAPQNSVAVWLDEHFDDERMHQIYPNAKKTY